MTIFLELKEKLKEIYAEYGTYILPVLKFFLALAVFQSINHTLDYVPALGNIFIVLILSLICAIIPLNGMVFFAMVLILLQCTGVHILAAAFGAVLFLALWVLYLRFAPGEALALVLTPLACALHIPAAVPIAFGLVGGPVSALSVSCGLVVYYFMRLIVERIAVLAAGEEIDMLNFVRTLAEGVFQNETLLVALICCAVTLLVVYLIRTLDADYAWQISVIAGGIAYLVIQLAGALFLELDVSVPTLLAGTVGSCLICFVLQLFVFGGDYSRSKMFRFQDDEYYYYVKAIPKMAVSNPKRTIKTISEEEPREDGDSDGNETADEHETYDTEEVLKEYTVGREEPDVQGSGNMDLRTGEIPEIPEELLARYGAPAGPGQDGETGNKAKDAGEAEQGQRPEQASGETDPEEQRKDEYFQSVDFEEKLTDTLKRL